MAAENGNSMPNLGELSYGTPESGWMNLTPLAHNAVTPTGPVTPSTYQRRAGAQMLRLALVSADPPAEAGFVQFYTRMIGTQQGLFACYPNGTVVVVGVV